MSTPQIAWSAIAKASRNWVSSWSSVPCWLVDAPNLFKRAVSADSLKPEKAKNYTPRSPDHDCFSPNAGRCDRSPSTRRSGCVEERVQYPVKIQPCLQRSSLRYSPGTEDLSCYHSSFQGRKHRSLRRSRGRPIGLRVSEPCSVDG